MPLNRRGFLRGMFAAAGVVAVGTPALAQQDDRRFDGYSQMLDITSRENSQYLLLFDTNHMNRAMPTYSLERGALDVAQKNGIKNVFIEFPREFQPLIDARASGKISHSAFIREVSDTYESYGFQEASRLKRGVEVVSMQDDIAMIIDEKAERIYLNRLSRGIEDAAQRGIRVVGADSGDFINKDRMNYDGQVADYIAQVAHGQKSVVTYGVLHGGDSKGAGLDDELRQRGGVTIAELQDNARSVRGPVGEMLAGVRELMGSLSDRASYRLNIDSGALTRHNDGVHKVALNTRNRASLAP